MQLSAAGCLSPQQNLFFSGLVRWLGSRLGASFTSAQWEEADLVYMCGLPTGLALGWFDPLVAPVMTHPRYGSQPIYFADVILRDGFAAATWADLAGCRFAYNEEGSFSGWAAVLIELRRQGIPAEALQWRRTGSHTASIELVAAGEADATALDSMMLELEAPRLNLKALVSLGPWPMPPISLARHRADLAAELTSLLTSLPEDEKGRQLLDGFAISHLEPVDRRRYQDLADEVSSLDLTGFEAST
ncbi:MAG: PhnD/SsuA/transferrin family substrate-binding protein [Acidimicrobiia bacterium]|nr:PhnD/SsuA/transferrin family substrate-binding protein [Acidimicrobiia bacterium]